MFYVYVLIEEKSGESYIGFSKDLKKRIVEHRQGVGAKFTKTGMWHLVYYEAFLSKKDALTRERKLKQNGNARHQLLRRVKGSIDWVKIGAGEEPWKTTRSIGRVCKRRNALS